MKIILFSIILSLNAFASECVDQVDLKLETDESITLCSYKGELFSKNCASQKEKCPLIKFLKSQKKTPEIIQAQKITSLGRPGSRICNILKLTVLMGQMPDGSQICVCSDQNKNYVSCNGPQHYLE